MSNTNWDDFTPAQGASKPANTASATNWDDFSPVEKGGTTSDLGKSLKAGVQRLPSMVTGLADLPIALATGARPFTKAADALGEATGFTPGKWADETKFSQGYEDSKKAVDAAWKDGGAADIAGAYLSNPGYTLNQVAESLPSMVAGGAASKLLLGAGRVAGVAADAAAGSAARAATPGVLARTVGEKWAVPVAAGVGEGAVTAGQQMAGYEGDNQQLNALASLGAGAGTGLIGAGAGRLANKMGLETAETAMARIGSRAGGVGGAGSDVPLSLKKRVLGGMVSEAVLQELPQSAQEQMWQNFAEGKPLMEGVARAGAEGALAGAVMGAGANLRGGRDTQAQARQNAEAAAADAQAKADAIIPPWSTELGAAVPGAAGATGVASAANAPGVAEADFSTTPGASAPREGGMDFTREVDTSGLRLEDPAEVERARAAMLDYEPVDATPQWDTERGAAPGGPQGLEMEPRQFDTGSLAIGDPQAKHQLGYSPLAGTPTVFPDGSVALGSEAEFAHRYAPQPVKPSQAMGIDPNAGPLSKSAALAVDSGAYMPPAGQAPAAAPEADSVVLQNRDRTSAASIAQMQEIAANPDYLRVGPSRDMTSGAPIVFGDLPPSALLGRPETVVDGKGERMGTQYAVVDAGDLIASNNADGTAVQEYASGAPGKLRSVAGNGRTAGLQAAYQLGTAQRYRQELADDAAALGVDAQAMATMQRPVLVRVMQGADVTRDMGDRTNITATQKLSPLEQAGNDARRLDVRTLAFDEGGSPTLDSIKGFVSAMPVSERGDMLNADGTPTRQAVDRLMAATFKQAYDSDELVQLYAQATDPDARAVMAAAADASGVLASLKGAGEFDVRGAVADAAKMAVNAARQGLKLSDVLQNQDMDMHPDAFPVAAFMAENIRTPRKMAEGLRRWGQLALEQARIADENTRQGSLLGPRPTLSRAEVFARLGSEDNPAGQAIAPVVPTPQPAPEQTALVPAPQLPQSNPNGAPNGPQADQAQQAAAQQPQAPVQATSAAVERHPTWRKNAIQAGRVARALGLEPKGKRLAQIVAEIDARDSESNQAVAPVQQAQAAIDSGAESAALMFSRSVPTPQDFVPNADGGLDYGEITPEMGRAMRRQAGKIRLQQGNERFGLAHIEARHGDEIRKAGFASIQEFVADIAKNIDQMWKPDATSQLVALHVLKNDRVMFVQLQPESAGGQDFYTVNTAFPSRAGYVANKKNWEMLWEGRAQPSQSATSEQTPFAAPPQKTGKAATFPSDQSTASVAPKESDAKPDVNFSFAGEKAATADTMALTTAQERLAAGEDAEAVRKDTGWHKAADGKWRFEISDAGARFAEKAYFAERDKWYPARFLADARDAGNASGGTGSLGAVLDHPALFAAYPSLRDMPVTGKIRKGQESGAFDGKSLSATAESEARLLSILLHEAQHGIQHIEGFAPGGASSQFTDPAADRSALSDGAILSRLTASQGSLEKAKTEFAKRFKREPALGAESAALSGESADSMQKRAAQMLEPHETYRRLAGETEARNTQTRQKLTDAERRATPPSQTADVPDADVIVTFNGKEMASAPAPANAGQATPSKPFQPLANQSAAKALNDTLVKYGLGQEWSNAYEAVKLPDALSGVREAIQAAFGRDVRSVAPTAAKFNIFNGIYLPGRPSDVYVNVAADVGFINIAGHELWHAIKRQRPDLIRWYQQHSRQFYKDLPAYRDRLNALVQANEKEYSTAKAEEELEADFMGDSLADPAFLQQLADASPSKFRALLNHVRLWLSGVAHKLKGLGSSQEVTDVKALRAYLKEVLVAFAEGKDIPAAPPSIASKVSPAAVDPTQTEAFKRWFEGSKAVNVQGKPLRVYHGTGGDFSVFERERAGATTGAANTGLGFFFTDNPGVAGTYARMAGGAQNTMPVYVSLQNPLRLSAKNMLEADKLLQTGLLPEHDGAMIEVAMRDGGTQTVYMVRQSSQAKSTIGNNGAFDPANPDIRFSRARPSAIESSMGAMTPEQERAYKKVAGVQKVPTLKERAAAFRQNLGLRMKQALVDQFAPIRDVSQHAYMMARMSKASDGAMDALLLYGKPFLRDGVLDVDINDGGFAKMLAGLKGEHDRFFMWVAAQRGERLKAEGKENLMGDADISALKTLNAGTMADGTVRVPLYAKALQELNAFNEAALKVALESGLIDQDAYDLMKDQPYVPFYRLMAEEGGMTGPKFSSGLLNQKAWKKLKGGTQQLNADLVQNALQNWSHLYAASARNRAALATMDAAEGMGVAYKVRAETKGSVKVMRAGMTEHWMIEDPYLLEAVSALNYTASPLMKPLAKMKQLLTWGVTVNPTFKIRNLIRDSISAISQSELGYNPLANVGAGWKLTASDSQVYASMLASGGVIKFGTQENTDRLRAQVSKLGGVVLDEGGLKKFTGQLQSLYDVYAEFGDRTENVNRAALYDQLIKKGHSHAEASFMARDLMDFSMGGSHPAVRFLTQTVPFLNARLQGLYKLGRAAHADPRKFAAVAGAVSLASLTLLAIYGDDDDWKKREDWDRDAYWWFKVGEVAFRIPKPFEVGAIGTLAERTAELMFEKEMTNKRFMERLGFMFGHTFAFDPVPQAFKPLLDIYSNKDSFTKRAIESQADQRLRPQDRYNERTSEVARLLGSWGLPDPAQLIKGEYAGLSPKQIDHLLRGYFSWAGATAATVSDFALRPAMGRGERPDMRLKDVFLVGNFVESLPTGSSRYVSQLYEQSRSVEQAYASYREALKTGDTDKAAQIQERDGPKLRNRMAYAHATGQLSEINAQAKRIEANRLLPGDVKRERLSELELRRGQVAKRLSDMGAG